MTSTSRTVRRLFRAICSYTRALGLEGRRHGPSPCGLLDLEELARTEPEQARHDVRRERLHEVVHDRDLVVVELPGERDLRLGARELLLQRQEVLARLQLRVVLRHRDEAPQPERDLVLRAGLVLDRGCLLALGPGPGDLLEQLPLMGRVTLHSLQEVRDEVVPPAEL